LEGWTSLNGHAGSIKLLRSSKKNCHEGGEDDAFIHRDTTKELYYLCEIET
jgi:hypothetical protein